jgi:hypothetical protein
MVLPDHLSSTELGRFLATMLEDVAAAICTANEVNGPLHVRAVPVRHLTIG